MQLNSIYRATRTPLLLVVGYLALITSPSLLLNLILFQSHHNPFHRFYCAAPSFHDCFLYLPTTLLSVPNAVKLLSYFIGLIALLEAKPVLFPQRLFRRTGLIAVVALVLAVIPWFVLLDIKGPNIRLLPFLLICTAIVWAFLFFNAGLPGVERFVSRSQWAIPLLEWTFPVSDVLCFKLHRCRIGSRAGLLRLIPITSYLTILIGLLSFHVGILKGSLKAEKMPVEVYDPHEVVYADRGFWYAETIRYDAGLWYYDTSTATSRSAIRVSDLDSFVLQDGFCYFHDGFDNRVLKVNAATRQVVWGVPVPGKFGAFDLVLRHGLIFALGKGGYLAILDTDGHRQAERHFAFQTSYLKALSKGRIVFASPDRLEITITTGKLADDEVIPLPLPKGVKAFEPSNPNDEIPVLTGIDYVEPLQMLYVATLWGEVFRYDLRAHRWLSSYRTMSGIRAIATDSEHGLLFLYNHARGYVDILSLESGKHLRYVLAPVFGNLIVPDSSAQIAILSAHGPGWTSLPRPGGLYRFSYRALSETRPVLLGNSS